MPALPAHRLASLLGDWRGHGPGYRDLADAIRMLVIDSRIPDGTRLPSERALAEEIRVSRTTTTRAYEELRERGLLASLRGSGSTVTLPLAASSDSSVLVSESPGDGVIAWTHAASQGAPGLALAFERALDRLPALLSTIGYLPDGYGPLRERIAAQYAAGGLPTDPSQIIVTSGAQGALATVAATLVSRGDRVLIEACGFPHVFENITSEGGQLMPLPHADRQPWRTADIVEAANSAELAFLVVDFHNPTGAVMPADQRVEAARALRRAGTQVIVDETLRHVNLDGIELPPPFAVHDPDAITIGSMSKIVWGGLRLGWIRAPKRLVTPLVQTRVRLDLGSSAFEQVVAVEALDAALSVQHLANLRDQRDALLADLAAALPEFRIRPPQGGLSLWAELPSRASTRLAAAAEDQGLRILPGSRFFASRGAAGERYVRLPFGRPAEVLTEAVARLARAWQTVEHGAPDRRIAEQRDVDLMV